MHVLSLSHGSALFQETFQDCMKKLGKNNQGCLFSFPLGRKQGHFLAINSFSAQSHCECHLSTSPLADRAVTGPTWLGFCFQC